MDGNFAKREQGLRLLACMFGLFCGCNADPKPPCQGRSPLYVGSLSVAGDNAPVELEQLRCVEVVTGSLSISDVGDLTPLRSLVQVVGDFGIKGNADLRSLEGLNSLTQVGSLTIEKSDALVDISALSNLTTIEGSLELQELKALKTLHGLEGVSQVGGDLVLSGLGELTSAGHLKALFRVAGNIEISYNGKLASLDDLFPRLGASGNLRIEDNFSLTDLTCPSVGGQVAIDYNHSLRTIHGLQGASNLASTTNLLDPRRILDVSVTWNTALESVEFDQFGAQAAVLIMDNPHLTKISGKSRDAIDMGYGIRLTLEDLPKLRDVSLELANFDELTVTKTGLQDLTGFKYSLINCSLSILENPELRSFPNELDGTFDQDFTVSANPKLNDCAAQATAQKLAKAPPSQLCLTPGEGYVVADRVIEVDHNQSGVACPASAP